MTNPTFTPGPLRVNEINQVGPISTYDDQTNGMVLPLADVYGDNAKADAILFAAAPDLYAALDLAKTTIDELYGNLSDPVTEPDAVMFDVMAVIISALSRANGGVE